MLCPNASRHHGDVIVFSFLLYVVIRYRHSFLRPAQSSSYLHNESWTPLVSSALQIHTFCFNAFFFTVMLDIFCSCACLRACCVCSKDRHEVLRRWCWVWMARARRVFFSALRQEARSRKYRPLRGSMPSLSTERSCASSSSRVRSQPAHTAWLWIACLCFDVSVARVEHSIEDIF